MSRIIYFDCFAGASGDMITGALLDAGLDFELLREQLGLLPLTGYNVSANRVTRGGLAATKFDVDVTSEHHSHRGFNDIREMIEGSGISDRAKRIAISIFRRLADAEARVHGTTVDEVHFHEVGAVDSIIDITAAAIGFDMLEIDGFYSSSVRVGFGTIKAAHGILPVPGPATADLLTGAPVYAGDTEGEFTTPTGAAILSTLCTFGPIPEITIGRTGYGAGTRDPKGLPNVLRVIIGEQAVATVSHQDEQIIVLETNIDDMNPQVYGFVFERAFELGALDVFTAPIQMKKDRPATRLSILAKPETLDALINMVLTETTTLGVRYYNASRRILQRTMKVVETKYGPVRVKVALDGRRTLHFQPEYDDCARIAREQGVPLIEVQRAASAAYGERMVAESDDEKPGD